MNQLTMDRHLEALRRGHHSCRTEDALSWPGPFDLGATRNAARTALMANRDVADRGRKTDAPTWGGSAWVIGRSLGGRTLAAR